MELSRGGKHPLYAKAICAIEPLLSTRAVFGSDLGRSVTSISVTQLADAMFLWYGRRTTASLKGKLVGSCRLIGAFVIVRRWSSSCGVE